MNKYYRKLKRQSRILASRMTEGAVFLRRFAVAPGKIGSITPSSPWLTRAVTEKIEWNATFGLAELGAGTGVFTRAIVRKMNPGTNFLVFEVDEELKTMLEKKHKDLPVYGDARELPRIMQNHGLRHLDCVVSSLPYAVLPAAMTSAIMDAVDSCLKPDGKLIAYQYSTHMKRVFEKRFKDVRISFVLRNVPPAFVYVCTGPRGGSR